MSFFEDTHTPPRPKRTADEIEKTATVVMAAVEALAACLVAVAQYKILRRKGAPPWAAWSITVITSELVQIRRAVTGRRP